MAYTYEWDETKREANLAKHGIDFAEVEGFEQLASVIVPDRRRDYGEDRFRAYFRLDGEGRALSFTWRGQRIRVISLRRAREREMRRYGV
jgi:uncharacterized DUF497 family protein